MLSLRFGKMVFSKLSPYIVCKVILSKRLLPQLCREYIRSLSYICRTPDQSKSARSRRRSYPVCPVSVTETNTYRCCFVSVRVCKCVCMCVQELVSSVCVFNYVYVCLFSVDGREHRLYFHPHTHENHIILKNNHSEKANIDLVHVWGRFCMMYVVKTYHKKRPPEASTLNTSSNFLRWSICVATHFHDKKNTHMSLEPSFSK